MPEKYKDWWYEDLPAECKKAAAAMGYTTKESWDDDHPVPYDTKEFVDLTLSEKRAALFLGWDIDREKLDIWWDDTDKETQAAALVIGWTKETWDDDWHVRDFPIEHKYWKELTDAERTAAAHFGYTRVTWDETGEVLFEDDGKAPTKTSAAPAAAPSSKEEETEDEAAAPAKTSSAPAKQAAKPSFAGSRQVGGEGGAAFDDLNHKAIKKISVYSGMIVDAIMVTYDNGPGKRHGGDAGKEHSIELDDDEYVTSVVVRHANLVHCLTFVTNKGHKLVAGGKGRPLIDKKGEETEFQAPNGKKLCGINGRAGASLDAIGLRWGPI